MTKVCAYSYLIYTDRGNVCARNGNTGSVDYCRADAATVIQYAINSLTPGRKWKENVILKGDFSVSKKIIIPSYTILHIIGKLTLEDNVDDYMIISNPYNENIGQGLGATDIEINGGILDANYFNNSRSMHTIEMTGVNNITVSNMKFVNGTNMALLLLNCVNVYVQNIHVESVNLGGRDGVHLQDCKNATVIGIRGNTYDDLIGITNILYDSSNITVSDVAGTSSGANIIDIANETNISHGKILSDILLSNITANSPEVSGIQIFARNNGTIRNIAINNFTVLSPRQDGLKATAEKGGMLEGLCISNFNIRYVTGYRGIFLLNVSKVQINNGYILDTMAHSIDIQLTDDLLISNMNIKNTVNNQNGVVVESGNRISLDNIQSYASMFPFQIGVSIPTTVTNLRMTNCYAKSGSTVGIDLQGNLTNAIISNNDVSDNIIGIYKDPSYNPKNVVINNNLYNSG